MARLQTLLPLRRRRNEPLKGLLAGWIGGLAGAWVMGQFQSAWSKVANRIKRENRDERFMESRQPKRSGAAEREPATVLAAEVISRKVFRHELNNGEKQKVAPIVHYAFGSGMGGLYGVLAEMTEMVTVGGGAAYGAALWLAADEVAVRRLVRGAI